MGTPRKRRPSTRPAGRADSTQAARHERLARGTCPTPIGDVLLLASRHGLCALEFRKPERMERLNARLARWFPPHEIVDEDSRWLDAAARWLQAYFAGRRPKPGTPRLDLRGAPFDRRVWEALLAIPAGSTQSYGNIARQLASPQAARAVGAAVGANPVSIIVPCHRAVGSNGSLVNYGGGLERKAWLLQHERRWRRDAPGGVSARRGA
ncbi:MAG TPA: methylated-DNA--[protein]-cysteine S-methyltransferase [Vicinamibacterales bacterium]|nr:methylated-DNA--[protein]-cysteine S-methyltransferase [Vicinamibacterales bacterium]